MFRRELRHAVGFDVCMHIRLRRCHIEPTGPAVVPNYFGGGELLCHLACCKELASIETTDLQWATAAGTVDARLSDGSGERSH